MRSNGRAMPRLRARLLCSAAIIAPLLMIATPAQADCTESAGVVTCSGTDSDGFEAPADTPVAATVESGASVEGGTALGFAPDTSGNTLTNNGSISPTVSGNASEGDAIGVLFNAGSADGDSSFTNAATILATRNGNNGNGVGFLIQQGVGASNITVTNASGATIDAIGNGGDSAGVVQRFTTSTANGPRFFTFNNAGVITGADYGVG